MKAGTSAVLTILCALLVLCSCSADRSPDLPQADRETLLSCIAAVDTVLGSYYEEGSYEGLEADGTSDGVFIFRFRECRVGKGPVEEEQAIVLNGEVKAKYHAFPQTYPVVRKCDLTYACMEETHAMRFDAYMLGKKTVKFSGITVDGKVYAAMKL